MTRNKFAVVSVLVTLFMFSNHAAAGIYKLVDENGHVTYTNSPGKNEQKHSSNAAKPSVVAKAMTSAPLAANSFPKVSGDQQRRRDINRRQILENELETETRLLEEMQQALNEATHTLKRLTANRVTSTNGDLPEAESIKKLRHQIASHERNIMALRTELKNL